MSRAAKNTWGGRGFSPARYASRSGISTLRAVANRSLVATISKARCIVRWCAPSIGDSARKKRACSHAVTLFMRSAHHGLDDPVVRPAAAKMLVERFAHLLFTRLLVRGKQSGGSHRDAAHAIAALRSLLGDQRLLHAM